MKRILVAYATNAGSTADVARTVGAEIAKSDVQVDVLPLAQVKAIDSYDGVVLGGPMIMGWHRGASGFLKQHRNAFRRMPLAVFVTAMSLTQTGETSVNGMPVYVDEKLPKPPEKEGRLNFRERYARVSNYARPIITATQPARPVSLAFFGGRLDYGRLKWWAVLFAMVIIQAPAGDRRNWTAIRAWGAELPEAFRQAGLRSLPEKPDGIFILANPQVTQEIVRQCVDLGIKRVWMHCMMGTKPGLAANSTSVSQEAVRMCRENGIGVIPGACPNQFLSPDFGHGMMRVLWRAFGFMTVEA